MSQLHGVNLHTTSCAVLWSRDCRSRMCGGRRWRPGNCAASTAASARTDPHPPSHRRAPCPSSPPPRNDIRGVCVWHFTRKQTHGGARRDGRRLGGVHEPRSDHDLPLPRVPVLLSERSMRLLQVIRQIRLFLCALREISWVLTRDRNTCDVIVHYKYMRYDAELIQEFAVSSDCNASLLRFSHAFPKLKLPDELYPANYVRVEHVASGAALQVPRAHGCASDGGAV